MKLQPLQYLRILLSTTTVFWVSCASAQSFNILRYDENWSEYQVDQDAPWYEQMKNIRIGDNDHLSFGGEARLLMENIKQPGWGVDQSDAIYYDRFVGHLDYRKGDNFRVFVQLHAAHARGEKSPVPGVAEDQLDIQNLFFDYRFSYDDYQVTIRPGRQELSFGSNRLVNEREGINVRRTFDGFRTIVQSPGGWRSDWFYFRPTEDDLGKFDDSPDTTEKFYGVFATNTSLPWATLVDLFAMTFEDEEANFATLAGNEQRYSIGGRLINQFGNWQIESEYFYQWGHIDDQDISAWSIATISTYEFSEHKFKPTVGIELAYATGDDDPNDGELNTFNPIFPPGDYFSELGQLGPQNFYNIRPTIAITPAPGWRLGADVAWFWRSETADGIYGPPRRLLRDAGGSDERLVATNISMTLEWAVNSHLELMLAATRSLPQDFLKETGPADVTEYYAAQITWKF